MVERPGCKGNLHGLEVGLQMRISQGVRGVTVVSFWLRTSVNKLKCSFILVIGRSRVSSSQASLLERIGTTVALVASL
jgi:hypothetical protein